LKNEAREVVSGTASQFTLTYSCSNKRLQILASSTQEILEKTAFVLPVVSMAGEEVAQPAPNEITILKPNGLVIVKASVPLSISEMPKSRTFNQVPGVEAVPILAFFNANEKQVEISIEVK
jgi:hypothetical protein